MIIVNHHLFFADLALRQDDFGSILPEYSAVVFDEAHEIEDVASDYFGRQVSNYRFEELARDAEQAVRALAARRAAAVAACQRECASGRGSSSRHFRRARAARHSNPQRARPFSSRTHRASYDELVSRAERRWKRKSPRSRPRPRNWWPLRGAAAELRGEISFPAGVEREELRLLVRAARQGHFPGGDADRRQRHSARAPLRGVRHRRADLGDAGGGRPLRFSEAAAGHSGGARTRLAARVRLSHARPCCTFPRACRTCATPAFAEQGRGGDCAACWNAPRAGRFAFSPATAR